MFRALCARHRENLLYRCDIWYLSICVADRLVCRKGWIWSILHSRRSATQID
jgi:hypothetical protein